MNRACYRLRIRIENTQYGIGIFFQKVNIFVATKQALRYIKLRVNINHRHFLIVRSRQAICHI